MHLISTQSPRLISITETSFTTMAKDTRVTFDATPTVPSKHSQKGRQHRVTERQISYEDAENCVNEMSESFPALSTRAHRIMRQVSGSFNSRTIKVALILSVILNLLLGIPFGIFFGFWMSQKNDSSSPSPSTSSASTSDQMLRDRHIAMMESCFPCSEFGPSSRVKVRSKNNICCTDDKIALEDSAYFYLSAEYYKKKVVGGTDSGRAPLPCIGGSGSGRGGDGQVSAAHMMLDVDQTKLNVKGRGTSSKIPLVWISHDKAKLTFIGDGVSYSNGEVTIRHSGKYHLYSHVTFSTNENPLSEGEAERIIVHSLLRSRGSSDALLFAQVTMKHNEVRSTNIEGSFDLEEGDVITVYVSYPSFLKNLPAANVFGLFML